MNLAAVRLEVAHQSGSSEVSSRLRARVRLTRRRLDREIAAGASIDQPPARALRARQLRSEPVRRTIATLLIRILEAADERQGQMGSELRLDDTAVLDAQDAIRTLIDTLRGVSDLETRGVAHAWLLTHDPMSPIFHPAHDRALADALAEIASAL